MVDDVCQHSQIIDDHMNLSGELDEPIVPTESRRILGGAGPADLGLSARQFVFGGPCTVLGA